MADRLEITWATVPMDRMVEYFVKGYERPVQSYDWFYDASKKIVVLKLYEIAPASPTSEPQP